MFPWARLSTLASNSSPRPRRVTRQLVELKNGETFNGHLVSCDNFMNVILREVFQTSADGERFWKMKECYIRGNTVSFGLPLGFSGCTMLGLGGVSWLFMGSD